MNFISANFAANSLNWSNKCGSEEPLDTLQPGGGLKRRSGASPGRGEQQDERTFTSAAQEALEERSLTQQSRGLQNAPHCKCCSPWRRKWKPNTEKACICYFTDSLPISAQLCAQLCHSYGHSYVHSHVHSCTAAGHLLRSAALVLCTVCSAAHVDWFCVSMFNSPFPVQLQSQSLPEA